MTVLINDYIIDGALVAQEKLDDVLVGMDECTRQITDLIIDFLTNGKGQCCLLEGESNCGRESLLQKLTKSSYDLPLRVINVGYLSADQTIQESLAKEEDGEKWVFLVRDADELLTAHQQEFLYTIADKATRHSWLVFFSVSRQNFLQNLEKRSNSRMPRIRVTFEQAEDLEEYCDSFRTLMNYGKEKTYDNFIDSLKCERWLRPLFEKYNYDVLKQTVAMILQRIVDSENESLEMLVSDVIQFATPEYNRKLEILQDLSLRSQVVFMCVHRLLKDRPLMGAATSQTTYRTVFLEYKKLVNTYYPLLNVRGDVFIFRELDQLVNLGLLRADKTTNVAHTSFRKVWMGSDPLTVEKYSAQLKFPTTVRDFFSTIPK